MTRTITILLLVICTSNYSFAQVGIGTVNPHDASILEVHSETKGFLPPRMDTDERDLINGGDFAEGLLIYNTDDECINFYNGDEWINPCEPAPVPLPTNMNINTDNQIRYITSILDDEYLPFTLSNVEANTNRTPIGSGNENIIDIEGILTTTGITITLPYTSSGSPTFQSYSHTVSVPSNLTEDGMGRDVIFEYTGGTAMDNGEIIMTIRAVGGPLKLLKLDLANGLGNGTSSDGNIPNAYGVLIAEAPIVIDDQGTQRYIQLRDVSAIPDRHLGDGVHNCIYLPITIDGKRWLNNNLGAAYSDFTNSSSFNLQQQSTAISDSNAFGSLYQWGRKSDGHQIVSWSGNTFSRTVGTQSSTSNTNTNPSHTDFLVGNNSWFGPIDLNVHGQLWEGPSGGVNNPCPYGYKVPTTQDWQDYVTFTGFGVNSPSTAGDLLKLSKGNWSFGDLDGSNFVDGFTLYWTSELASTSFAHALAIGNGNVDADNVNIPARGFKVRCIEE